jgi:hypothetical protein
MEMKEEKMMQEIDALVDEIEKIIRGEVMKMAKA